MGADGGINNSSDAGNLGEVPYIKDEPGTGNVEETTLGDFVSEGGVTMFVPASTEVPAFQGVPEIQVGVEYRVIRVSGIFSVDAQELVNKAAAELKSKAA